VRFLHGSNLDRRIGLIILGVMLLLIVGISILAPASGDSDPTPTTYNSGTAGAKAVYLLMAEIGFNAKRWDSPPSSLRQLDAAHSTLVLADPDFPSEEAKQVQADIADFLSRGGRVLATGRSGAYLLPGGRTARPTQILKTICHTKPTDDARNSDALALAGNVSISEEVRWDPTLTSIYDATKHANPVTVSQRCGADAVVVSFSYGAGEAVWWSSPMPLTNGGLKEDASLKLLLASIAPGHEPVNQPVDEPNELSARRQPTILFDEYFHGERESLWDTAKGLPLTQLAWQCALVGVLLVLSFGRRNGPLRLPVRLPRTSPIEFAESMGRIYRSAGATSAATDGARRRLLQFLGDRCGVPREILRTAAPDAIVESLQTRFGGDWSRLGGHLAQAAEAEYAILAPRSALDLVRALDRDQRDLAAAATAAQPNRRVPAA
jgi:Domain of unknown function (DUF4350)